MKHLSIHCIFVFLLISMSSCQTTKPENEMKDQFDAYIEAVNEHRTEDILALLSEDFELHFTGSDFIIDKKGMTDVLGWDRGVNGKVTYQNLRIQGDSISGLFTEQNEFFQLLDIREMKAEVSYKFNDDGLIKKQVYTSLPDQPAFQDRMQPVIEWAKTTRPEEIRRIYPNDQMIYNEEMGRQWVKLLREWQSQRPKSN